MTKCKCSLNTLIVLCVFNIVMTNAQNVKKYAKQYKLSTSVSDYKYCSTLHIIVVLMC